MYCPLGQNDSRLHKSRVQVPMPSAKTFSYKKLCAVSPTMYYRGRAINSVLMIRLNCVTKRERVGSK